MIKAKARLGLSQLRDAVKNRVEKTNKIHNEQVKKRKKKVDKKKKADSFDLFHGADSVGQVVETVVNSKDVRQWFQEGLDELCEGDGDVKVEWGVVEGAVAKRLLKKHGPERLCETIKFMFENWERWKKTRKVYGVPTVRFLSAAKSLFAEAQGEEYRGEEKKSSHASEFREGEDIGIGW
jgi:hypothetical protein